MGRLENNGWKKRKHIVMSTIPFEQSICILDDVYNDSLAGEAEVWPVPASDRGFRAWPMLWSSESVTA